MTTNIYPVPQRPVGRAGPQIVSPVFATIPATIGSYTWRGVAATLSAITVITAAVGAYTWSGNKSSLSTEIVARVGTWSWAGKSSPLSTEVRAAVGAYTWAGLHSPIQGVTVIPAAIGVYLWSGLTSPLQGQTPPTVATGSGGGGRYFGYYPERAREVRAEIRSLTKEKKRIERRFKLAPNNVDLARLAELLTQLQQRLNVLIAEYEELIHVQAKAPQAQEEDELFLVNLFSRSFYND